jgi:hypothetical protein
MKKLFLFYELSLEILMRKNKVSDYYGGKRRSGGYTSELMTADRGLLSEMHNLANLPPRHSVCVGLDNSEQASFPQTEYTERWGVIDIEGRLWPSVASQRCHPYLQTSTELLDEEIFSQTPSSIQASRAFERVAVVVALPLPS